jgi:hypothetical protein
MGNILGDFFTNSSGHPDPKPFLSPLLHLTKILEAEKSAQKAYRLQSCGHHKHDLNKV